MLSRNSRVGSASGLLTPDCVSEGPIARTITLRGADVAPENKTSDQPVVASLDKLRVLIFASLRGGRQVKIVDFYQPNATSPFLPRRRKYRRPGDRVAMIADSRLFGGASPVFIISVSWVFSPIVV